MTTYLLVDDTNTVINIIDWDGVKDYTPPIGKLVSFAGPVGIGWKWNGKSATDSNPQVSQLPQLLPTPPSITSQLALELGVTPVQLSIALKATIAAPVVVVISVTTSV
jgi:hypothetical protein